MSDRFRNPLVFFSLFAVFVSFAFWGGRIWERSEQDQLFGARNRQEFEVRRSGDSARSSTEEAEPRIEIAAVDESAGDDRDPAKGPGVKEAEEAFESLRTTLMDDGEFSWTLETYRIIGNLRLEALPHFLELTDSFRLPHVRYGVQNVVFERWSEANPEEAVSFILESPTNSSYRGSLSKVYRVWAQMSFEAAQESASGLSESNQRYAVLKSLVDMLRVTDPDGAARLENRLGIATSLVVVDRTHEAYLAPILEKAKLDPWQALELAENLTDRNQKQHALQRVLRKWAQSDAEEALSALETVSDYRMRRSSVSDIVSQVAKEDPSRALALLDNLPGNWIDPSSYNGIFNQWAESDLKRAAEASLTLENRQFLSKAIAAVAHVWAQQDARNALRWSESIPSNQIRRQITNQIVSQWSNRDPEQAALYVASSLTGQNRQNLIQSVANQWGHQRPSRPKSY